MFTSGNEAELFLNGKSRGRNKKGPYECRLRWDDVVYRPGALMGVAYKNGRRWAKTAAKAAGEPARLKLEPDRNQILTEGRDLCFITVSVTDNARIKVPCATRHISFAVQWPGKIVPTDNGDPTDFDPFPSHSRRAFNAPVPRDCTRTPWRTRRN